MCLSYRERIVQRWTSLFMFLNPIRCQLNPELCFFLNRCYCYKILVRIFHWLVAALIEMTMYVCCMMFAFFNISSYHDADAYFSFFCLHLVRIFFILFNTLIVDALVEVGFQCWVNTYVGRVYVSSMFTKQTKRLSGIM